MEIIGSESLNNNEFVQHVILFGRRKNFVLSFEFVKKSDDKFYLNNIIGLCDFLDDIKNFLNHQKLNNC